MDKKRVIGWLIPVLYGFAIGIFVAWVVGNVGPGRDSVFESFGIMALLSATYLKLRTGYNWPWEGQTEWAQAQVIPAKTFLRNFWLWSAIVVALLVLFTLLQLRVN